MKLETEEARSEADRNAAAQKEAERADAAEERQLRRKELELRKRELALLALIHFLISKK